MLEWQSEQLVAVVVIPILNSCLGVTNLIWGSCSAATPDQLGQRSIAMLRVVPIFRLGLGPSHHFFHEGGVSVSHRKHHISSLLFTFLICMLRCKRVQEDVEKVLQLFLFRTALFSELGSAHFGVRLRCFLGVPNYMGCPIIWSASA